MRYLRAQPYGPTSALLFVSVPGAGAAFNHPEIVGRPVAESGETAADEGSERRLARGLVVPRLGYTEQRVPDIGPTRILERRVNVGTLKVVVGAGEPLAVVERAQHGVGQTFLLAALITLLPALLVAYLAGARLSAPLRRMASVATRVDAGELEPRMDVARGGGEVSVLAEAFNNMLDRLTGELKGQREFIADASHELRTPITVIRGQIEVLAAEEAPTADDVRRAAGHVQHEITRISRLVDDLLLLAQAEHRGFLRPEPVELETFVEQLWDGISLTARRHFELGPVPAGTLFADPDRLAQALRNLAGNAIRHTAERRRAWCVSRSTRSFPERCASPCSMTGPGSRSPSASGCSSASIAPIRRAAAPRAAPDSAWPSCARSPMPIVARSVRSRPDRRAGPASS